MNNIESRRRFMSCCGRTAILAGTVPWIGSFSQAFGKEQDRPFRIGICDWSIKSRGKPSSFGYAKELGFEGVEVSFQPGDEFTLQKKENRTRFLELSKESGIAIASLAMGILNSRPLATEPDAPQWVSESIDAMSEMNLSTILLAFFGDGDIKDNTDARKKVVEILKKLAPKAEQQKRTLGIESYLNAKEHLEMLQEIGSDAVKVYYDERNMLAKEYPVYEDLELLLKEKAVCQVHVKENGCRLGEGPVDFPRIRKILEKYEYKGWLIAEGAQRGDWKESQAANAAFLKKTFLQ